MGYLFDANKPHFNVWLSLYDMDTYPIDYATFSRFAPPGKSPAGPLYYAALCGFNDLLKHLVSKHPQDVNADGGYYMRPLVAALAGEHFQTADLLRYNGADVHVRGTYGTNPLHAAAFSENFEVVQILLECNPADIHARDDDGWTPLHWASGGHNFKNGSVVRLLLEHMQI
jgi:ankyrin repeat protein